MELALDIRVNAQQAKAELSDTDRAIVRTSKYAEELGKSSDAAMKRLDKGFAEAEKAAASLEKQVEKLGQTSERKTTPAMGGLNSTLMRYASGAVVMAAIKATADYADKLEDLAGQTDMSIAAMSKFDGAARRNGATIDLVATAVETLQDRIGGGDKSLVRGLDRLGISLDSVRKMSSEEQFLTLTRALSGVKDQTERMTIANDLFGGSAKKLLPTLVEIGENYEKLPGLSDEAVKSTAKLTNAFDDLKLSGMNALVNFLAPFGEALGMIAGKLKEVDGAKVDWSKVLPGGYGIPYNMLQNAYQKYTGWQAGDAAVNNIKAPAGWTDLVAGGSANKDTAMPDGFNLLGTDKFGGYAGALESQINDQLREQAKLHKARGDASEAASKQAAKAAAEELAIWRNILEVNHRRVEQAQGAVGEDFDLFFGRGFSDRGGLVQGQSYWGQTELAPLQSRSLAGVMGPIYGPSSAGNIANGFARPGGGAGVNTLLDYAGYFGNGNVGGQLADTYRGALQTQNQLGRFGVGSQMMTGSTANRLAAGATAGIGIAQGAMDVWGATDKAGAGDRALGGAMAGAKAGAMFGPWGMAIGAAAGLVVGLVRGKPEWAKAADEVGRDFGVKISDGLAKEIAKTSKELFKGDRSAANQYHLADIIKEGGGLNAENIDKMTGKLRDTFSGLETGKFNKEQATKVLDENFGAFADYFDRIGGLASKKFGEIIELQRRFGLESAAVTEYVGAQTETAVTGLGTFFEHATVTSADAATGLMGAAVLLFEELKKGPDGLKGAMAEMAPIIAGVEKALADTGAEASVTFHDMRSLLSTMANEDVANAVTAVSGLGKTLVGMSNAVLLNEDTYRGLSRAITDTRNSLVAQGHDGEHVNRLMQEDLQTIWELQKNNGYAVDEVTQKLLDEAEAQGIVGQKFKEVNQQMLDLQREGFTALIEAVGGEVPESWRAVEEASAAAEQKVKDDAAQMAAAQGNVSGSVEEIGRRLQAGQTDWSEWARAGVAAAEEVSFAVDAVSLGHSPGGIKEIPIKLKEAIDAAHLFKRQAVADFEATEAAVNALSDEQEEAIRLLVEVGRPLDDIAFALDMSTQSLELFIDREREAAAAAEDAARAVENQRVETERMAESLLAMERSAKDELSLLSSDGMNREMLQLSQRQRDEVAAAEAMRPTLGSAVDATIAFITQKFDILRADVMQKYTEQAERDRLGEEQRRLSNQGRYDTTFRRLQDQITLIGKSGLERELLQLGFGQRDEVGDIQRMHDMLSGTQIEALLSAVAIKYAKLEAEARAEEAARVSGAMMGGYVGAHGIQYLRTGGNVLGFVPRGTDTVPAMLTPGEGVLSRRGMQALSSLNRGEAFGDSIVFEAGSIVVNGADDPEAVADAILRKVAQKRKLSRGRRAA